jgi:Aldehyde dehydrogenase family
MHSVDPATDEVLGEIPDMGIVETREAIDAAAVAFKSWSKTTAKVCRHTHDSNVSDAYISAVSSRYPNEAIRPHETTRRRPWPNYGTHVPVRS